jgi:hypothetical protein
MPRICIASAPFELAPPIHQPPPAAGVPHASSRWQRV